MKAENPITLELKRIQSELRKLKGYTIHVGIQGVPGKDKDHKEVKAASADILTIAGVHEYGATIHAKNVRNLAIPIHKLSKGKSPAEFDNLFFIEADGLVYGCISPKYKGKRGPKTSPNPPKPKKQGPKRKLHTGRRGDILFLFLLLPSVTIPERSFIRAGFDHNRNLLDKYMRQQIDEIILHGRTAKEAIEYIGGQAVSLIQTYMRDSAHFKPKSDITKASLSTEAQKEHPLYVSGRLVGSVTYYVEEVK